MNKKQAERAKSTTPCAGADRTIVKYLAHYAEQEVSALASFPVTNCFEHVVVIPAYQESTDFVERFVHSTLAQQQCLLIVVINQPESALGQQHRQMQIDLAQYIIEQGSLVWQAHNLSLVTLDNSAILIVDRFNHAILPEQGVGLARKIGADIAVALINKKQIYTSWVHSSDADAHLPDNYFDTHANNQDKDTLKGAVATCCNFYHYSEKLDIHQANLMYENALRYYVAGLCFANSPYAYFTIGSTLAFKAISYCQARGFPKRSAGEDFYLLNKLAKLGAVTFLANVHIKLDARTSTRVPFGTGPAVQSILDITAQGQPFPYYHPEVFIALKRCLHAFENLWPARDYPQDWLAQFPHHISQALQEIGMLTFIKKQKSASQVQFNKQLTVWFDSFKTLKFIHAIRDLGAENIPLEQAIEQAPFSIF